MAKKKGNSSPAPKPIPAPKASAPKASAPKAAAPKASAPKASAPKASAQKASAPAPKAKAVTAAKTAASTGSFNQSNAKELRQAGVSKERIQTIRGQSQQTAAQQQQASTPTYRNSAGDTIRTNPGEMPADVAARAKELGIKPTFVPGLMEPGQKGYNAETGGGNWVFAQGKVDPEQLRAWYRGDPNNGTDLALEGKNRSDFTLDGLYGSTSQSSAAQQAQQSSPTGKSQKSASGLKQALRIAGSDGNITKKELNKATKQFGKTSVQAVRQLDQLNAGLKDRGKNLKIGLGSNAVNSIIKNTAPGLAQLNQFANKLGVENPYGFGSGKIGKSVSNYLNSSFSPTGLMSRNQRSSSQSAAGLIPLQAGGAYQVNSAGGYSPKVSNKAFGNPIPRSEPTPAAPSEATPEAMPSGTMDSFTPEPYIPPVEETQSDPGAGMMSGGGMGAAGANKLGRAKSRLRQLGIYGRGTGLLNRGLQYGNALNK